MSDVKITVNPNGPLKVEGAVELVDAAGNAFPARDPMFLCRCGGSVKKPFCDGTHSRIGFQGAEQAVKQSEGNA